MCWNSSYPLSPPPGLCGVEMAILLPMSMGVGTTSTGIPHLLTWLQTQGVPAASGARVVSRPSTLCHWLQGWSTGGEGEGAPQSSRRALV